jgi:hypothetical protein
VPVLAQGPNAGFSGKVVDECEIDRLLFEDKITANEHSTLNVLLRKLMKANFVGMRSPSLEAPIQSDPSIIADKKANLIRSVNRMIESIDQKIGRPKRIALVNLVLMDTPWPDPYREKDWSLKEAIARCDAVF